MLSLVMINFNEKTCDTNDRMGIQFSTFMISKLKD